MDKWNKDVVLARATITEIAHGAEKTLVYEFIDTYDDATNMTAMMRTTAFPPSITAQMLAGGTITARGVLPPEISVPDEAMIAELQKRHLRVTKRVTETWG